MLAESMVRLLSADLTNFVVETNRSSNRSNHATFPVRSTFPLNLKRYIRGECERWADLRHW
jgi:hypothetical protein